ncbi:hypothetical protein [Lysobacter firmicutimachus]|uniref:Uncharacterized protein n=1 Tax=Lysobacter firmicutimachus TaxID=1792846 RepID=A0ABU8D0N3_9GAMM
MNQPIATPDVSTEIESRPQWSAMPSINELMNDVAFNDKQSFNRSVGARIQRGATQFAVACSPGVLGVYAGGALHVLYGVEKETLRPYVLASAAWVAAGAVVGLAALAREAYRAREYGWLTITDVQANVMDDYRALDEITLHRLAPVPLLQLEEAKIDLSAQSVRATSRAQMVGFTTAAMTSALNLAASALGFTSPPYVVTLIAALLVGFGFGGALYFGTKSHFDRVGDILSKAILRAKDRKTPKALDV